MKKIVTFVQDHSRELIEAGILLFVFWWIFD